MVDALEEAAEGYGVPDLFLGTIIVPIVGNAAEHAAAIIFAAKNKMELSLGIAVGSAAQASADGAHAHAAANPAHATAANAGTSASDAAATDAAATAAHGPLRRNLVLQTPLEDRSPPLNR
eukprot:6189985-Pleurochrysis_carterae.AAC.1